MAPMLFRLLTTLLLPLPLTWGGGNIYKLYQNYILAKKIGVPIVVLPLSPQNPIWMLLADIIVPLFQKSSITRSWPLIRFGRRAWEFKDKAQIHLEIGDVFIMVTPDENVLYICDADTLNEVLLRRNKFKRPREVLEMLNVFGPNISTVADEDWPRHKKATGPPFSNEQTNRLGVLALWTTAEDAKTFSLNILSSAGFGKSYPFRPLPDPENDPNHSMSYNESLSLIVGNAIPILIIGPNFLLKWRRHLPKSLQEIAQATVEFQAYMKEMVQEERKLIATGKQSKPNLMTSLIRASHSNSDIKSDATYPGSKQPSLSEPEILETCLYLISQVMTRCLLRFVMLLISLLLIPTVQDWISEEVNAVFLDSDASTWDYEDSFPKLKRCMAVMRHSVFTTLLLHLQDQQEIFQKPSHMLLNNSIYHQTQ
ncbi:uncharacterized protein EAF01_003052 [Botrytis porri]|uniref:uncharacterized protein n=1 Tax=Botrytis porri TaxID=87229 RepID=UPI00190232AB|nr:uncharacterized protein EAF01_003052 [Botrytis porri]KAF7909334.1 hypothetical protein EAF01_003052 [Botrytis porri]